MSFSYFCKIDFSKFSIQNRKDCQTYNNPKCHEYQIPQFEVKHIRVVFNKKNCQKFTSHNLPLSTITFKCFGLKKPSKLFFEKKSIHIKIKSQRSIWVRTIFKTWTGSAAVLECHTRVGPILKLARLKENIQFFSKKSAPTFTAVWQWAIRNVILPICRTPGLDLDINWKFVGMKTKQNNFKLQKQLQIQLNETDKTLEQSRKYTFKNCIERNRQQKILKSV